MVCDKCKFLYVFSFGCVFFHYTAVEWNLLILYPDICFIAQQLIYVIFAFDVLGQAKLGKVITPDPWKTGARNTTGKCLVLHN